LVFVAATDFANLPFEFFVAALILTQGSQSLTAGNMQVIGSIIAPDNIRGRFFGVWRMVGEIGSTSSPIVFALLAEFHSYAAGFLTLSVAAFAASVLLWTQVRRALEENGAGPAEPRREAAAD
jgi:sugar phosphate permease